MKKYIDNCLKYLTSGLMGIMVLVCCWQVFTRYILGNPSKVTEEFLRYSLIWITMLGAPYAYGKEKHLSITFLTKQFENKGTAFTKFFVELVVVFFSIFVLVIGGIQVSLNSIGQVSAAMQLPMPLLYASLPTFGVLMLFYSIIRLKEHIACIKNLKNTDAESESVIKTQN